MIYKCDTYSLDQSRRCIICYSNNFLSIRPCVDLRVPRSFKAEKSIKLTNELIKTGSSFVPNCELYKILSYCIQTKWNIILFIFIGIKWMKWNIK